VFFLNSKRFPYYLVYLGVYLLTITIPLAIYKGELLNVAVCIMILLLPFSLSLLDYHNKNLIKGSYLTFTISLMLLLLWKNYNFLQNWNFNIISILLYFGLSSACLILANNYKGGWLWLLYFFAAINLINTESRNTAIAITITILLLIFRKIVVYKLIFRTIYILSISFTYIFLRLTEIVANDANLYDFLLSISIKYFSKFTIFNGRIPIYQAANNLIHESLAGFILGQGRVLITFFHAHNNYYQSVYLFGIIGTILIAFIFIGIFEMSYKLIKSGDNVVYGVFCILIGTFIQLGGENFLVGTTLIMLMPFVYMAIVVNKYRFYLLQKSKSR
jgi:hypothetical protein